jgi:hypothetical protein
MFTKDIKDILCGPRVWFIFGGAVLGFVATWIFAFHFYGMPWTTSGVDGVLSAAIVGVLSGCVLGGMLAYFLKRRSHRK